MYLLKLYSEPIGLFDEVEFKNGINFIYGKKLENEPKGSLNSIGKSTFLDLLDFCLLASYQKAHNPRLVAAHDILKGYYIVLEFSLLKTKYILKRTVDDPKTVLFGTENNLLEYKIEQVRDKLGNLIFNIPDYQGVFYSKWYRCLMNFYLKVQKFKRDQFLDPIKYMKEVNETEINIYQLYLLGLNNRLSFENYKIKTDLKKISPAIKQIQSLLSEKYDLDNLSDTNQNINKLRYDIKRFEEAVNTFHLKGEYENIEEEANKLTQTIKDKWFQNFSDRKIIDAYKASFSIPDKVSTIKIKNIYQELSVEFAIAVKKTLDEAINFRKKLAENRKTFLHNEIDSISSRIEEREIEISELEKDRAKLFSFLSAKEAIKDLTEAFNIISEKKSQLGDLVSNTKILNDLISEKNQIEVEQKKVDNQIFEYVNSLEYEIDKLYEQFTLVYNNIYINQQNESGFSIDFNNRKDKLIDISINMPDMFGKGKNQGRTLVYDLFVLLNSFNFSNSFPRFLIHDGIFDGVDKAHFISVYEFIENLSNKGVQIQYITTINEEGTLNDKFGHADKVIPEKIETEAILVLTSNKKLFKKDFKNTEVKTIK
jgi:uncharacterized protein YydD (DUF2326 family)